MSARHTLGASSTAFHAKRFTTVMRITQVTALLTTLMCLMAAPSRAFHDSDLDRRTKRFLASLIVRQQSQCDNGEFLACRRMEKISALGNDLAEAEEFCANGNRAACRKRDALRKEVAALRAQDREPGGQEARRPDPEDEPSPKRPAEGAGAQSVSPGAPGASSSRCTPEQVLALFDRGLSKDEVRQYCPVAEGERKPGENKQTNTSADDQPPTSMGWLRSALPMGQDGNWHAYSEETVYVLENQQNFGFRAFGIKPEPGEEGRRRISVQVKVDGEDEEGKVIGAGVMFAGNPETKEFYAFALAPDQSVRLYEYNPDSKKFHQTLRMSNESIKKNDFNRLEVVEKEGMVELSINGSDNIMKVGSSGIGQGATGIFVAGKGQFRFTDFKQEVD